MATESVMRQGRSVRPVGKQALSHKETRATALLPERPGESLTNYRFERDDLQVVHKIRTLNAAVAEGTSSHLS
jgi:hypothetical protein